MSNQAAAGISPSDFKISEGYRRYVVWLLSVVYVLNFVDRQILTMRVLF
jgi:hypothetical protein